MPENNDGRNPYSIWNMLSSREKAPLTPQQKRRKRLIITIAISIPAIYMLLSIIGSAVSLHKDFLSEYSPNPIKLLITCFSGGAVSILFTTLILVFVPRLASKIANRIVEKDDDAPYTDELGRLVKTKGTEGQSEIMRDEELEKVFTICDTDDVIGRGYIVGTKKDTGEAICKERGRANFEQHLSNENAGAFGPAGTGKSTGCLLPNILNSIAAEDAIVVYDPKGELYIKSKGILLAHGYKVKLFITKASQITHSDGWDCMKLLRESENAEPLAEMFSETLLKNVGGADTPYWGPANHGLLTMCLLYVAKAESFVPTKYSAGSTESRARNYDDQRTFSEVIELFTGETKNTQRQIKEAIDSSEHDRKLLKAKYNTWAGGDHTEQISSGLANSLSRFTTQTVAEILSSDEINFEELTEKTALFIISDTDEETYRALSALLFNSMMYKMKGLAELNRSQSLHRFLQIYIDELPSIGRIPLFENYMKTIRSYNIGIYYIAQSIDDLYDVYGESGKSTAWIGILENTPLQLCLGANSDAKGTSTKNYFSERSGKVTMIQRNDTMSKVTYVPRTVQEILNVNRTERETEKGVPVYPPDAISKIKPTEILISPAMHNSVIQGKYHWEMHPLHDCVLIDKDTGKEAEFLPAKHVPPRKGGNEDDMSRYIVASRKAIEKTSGRKDTARTYQTRGVRDEDAYL